MNWLLKPKFSLATAAAMSIFVAAGINGEYVVGAIMVSVGVFTHAMGERIQ